MKADLNRSRVMERPGRHHEVESEVPDTTVADRPTGDDMKAHLRSWGVGLIPPGVVHLVASFLDPIWGV